MNTRFSYIRCDRTFETRSFTLTSKFDLFGVGSPRRERALKKSDGLWADQIIGLSMRPWEQINYLKRRENDVH
jgi:hypothetical protein